MLTLSNVKRISREKFQIGESYESMQSASYEVRELQCKKEKSQVIRQVDRYIHNYGNEKYEIKLKFYQCYVNVLIAFM